jgi:hypothetical protein
MSISGQSIGNSLRKQPLLAAAFSLSLVLGATIYLRSGLLDEQQLELDRHSEESSRQRANIANAAQLQEQLQFLIQANEAVRNRALTVEGLAQNLQYFYRLESEIGIKYIDLRAGLKAPAVKSPIYVPLNYIVSVQGSFSQVISFLRRLEQGAYFCRVNSALTSSTDSVVTLNLNVDFLAVP